MSGPERKPDDTLLEDFLAGKSDLSRAYAITQTPTAPASLDATVLAIAKQAPATHPARWKRLRTPIALAATVVLGLGVMLNIQRDPGAYREASAPTAMSEEAAIVAVEVPAAPPAAPPPKSESRKKPVESLTAPSIPKSMSADTSVEAEAVAMSDSSAPVMVMEEPAAPAQDMLSRQPASAPAPVRERRAESDYRSSMSVQKMMAPPPAAAGAMASTAEPESSGQWLARIRELRAANKEEEARQQWRDYRVAYPDAPVPDDLKAWVAQEIKP